MRALEASWPYEFEVELRAPAGEAMRANLNSLDGFEIVDDRVVRVDAQNVELGFRRVASPGYADTPGVTRH